MVALLTGSVVALFNSNFNSNFGHFNFTRVLAQFAALLYELPPYLPHAPRTTHHHVAHHGVTCSDHEVIWTLVLILMLISALFWRSYDAHGDVLSSTGTMVDNVTDLYDALPSVPRKGTGIGSLALLRKVGGMDNCVLCVSVTVLCQCDRAVSV